MLLTACTTCRHTCLASGPFQLHTCCCCALVVAVVTIAVVVIVFVVVIIVVGCLHAWLVAHFVVILVAVAVVRFL